MDLLRVLLFQCVDCVDFLGESVYGDSLKRRDQHSKGIHGEESGHSVVGSLAGSLARLERREYDEDNASISNSE